MATIEMESFKAAADCWSESLHRATRFVMPFVHFRARKLFPPAIAEALAEWNPPRQTGTPADGRREKVKERIYFNRARFAQEEGWLAVALTLQSGQVAAALQSLCGASLDGTYLRIEYAADRAGFWLEPHTDLGVKRFTGLIALAGDPSDDLGTDLYASPSERACRTVFEPNGATLFVPGPLTWHGFAPRPMGGLRKSLIVNYVGPEWQSRDQLAFPDRPVRI